MRGWGDRVIESSIKRLIIEIEERRDQSWMLKAKR